MVEMREEANEPSWFARWEEELPSPEELMPLSQTLITPDLALAFDIPILSNSLSNPPLSHHPHHNHPSLQSDFDSVDLAASDPGASATNAGDETARTLKRPRLVWTPQLHKRFVDAVAHLGIKNAVPKTIMQLMSVDGLTRENVASHLQKYRLYLKRMQGLTSSGPGGGSAGPMSAADAATDQLFANGPIPHFLNRSGVGPGGHGHGPESFVPFVPMAALQQHHQHQMVVAAQQQQQYYQQRQQQQQLGRFGSPTGNANGTMVGGFDHGFVTRAMPHAGMNRIGHGGALHNVLRPTPQPLATPASYGDEERGEEASRKVLTLFPTGED